jgi:Ribbon-helix-helix protein, copG family
MKKTLNKKKPISAEAIARMADQGKDINRFFTGGKMMNPIQRVNVDFTAEMLEELDHEAAGLNISRQAVIKTLVREGLDRRYPRRARGTTRAQKAQGRR